MVSPDTADRRASEGTVGILNPDKCVWFKCEKMPKVVTYKTFLTCGADEGM